MNSKDTNLSDKLQEWENGILSMQIFKKIGDGFQRFTKKKYTSHTKVFGAAILNMIVLISGLLITFIVEKKQFVAVDQVFYLSVLLIFFGTAINFLLCRWIKRSFSRISNHIINVGIDSETRESLIKGFSQNDKKLQLGLGIGMAVFSLLIIFQIELELGEFSGIGIQVINLWGYFLFGLAFYLVISLYSFPLKISNFKYKIYGADPSSTLFIRNIAKEFNRLVTSLAIAGAVGLLIIGISVPWNPILVMVNLIIGWLPIIILFVINQISIDRIISRSKWEKLNEIQNKITELETTKNTEDKETMDSIIRLMDYHDRIQSTRNSNLNLRAIVNFINSLLVTLVGSVIGQIEKVISFIISIFK